MKTTQHAKSGVKKLPKARVMACDDDDGYPKEISFQVHQSIAEAKASNGRSDLKTYHCAVIPTATAKQAKAIASFFNLSEDGQVEALAKELAPDCGKWAGECARAVLRRIKERR